MSNDIGGWQLTEWRYWGRGLTVFTVHQLLYFLKVSFKMMRFDIGQVLKTKPPSSSSASSNIQ